MDDSDYLRLLTHQAEQANAFLSNARKWERERWVCQRLLQALNVRHHSDDFNPSGQEPPDVLFREANFEVFFVLDEGRRLNDEWRAELERRRSAFSRSAPQTYSRQRNAGAPGPDLAQEGTQLPRARH